MKDFSKALLGLGFWFVIFSVIFAIMFFTAAFWTWIVCLSYGIQFYWKYTFGTMVLIYLFGRSNPKSEKKIKNKLKDIDNILKTKKRN